MHDGRFRIEVRRRSRRRQRLLAAAAAGASAATVMLAARAAESPVCAALALVALLATGVLLGSAWGIPEATRIEIHRDGSFVSRQGEANCELEPQWITESIAVFRGGERRIVLWRDEIDASDWRRVRSFARWQLFRAPRPPVDELPTSLPVSAVGVRKLLSRWSR